MWNAFGSRDVMSNEQVARLVMQSADFKVREQHAHVEVLDWQEH
jgi:hypothetical protein